LEKKEFDSNFAAIKLDAMQGIKQQQEKLFHTVQLSELVPETNLYRILKGELDKEMQFLYKATRHLYGDTGNPGIDPVVFFKLILVAYLENIISDRKLVETSSMRMDIKFFLGYGIDESLPVHSTISRTRQLYPRELFTGLFNQVFGMCVKIGIVGGHTQSVDSALIKANASIENMELKQPNLSVEQFISQSEQENNLQEKKVQETPATTMTTEHVASPKEFAKKKRRSAHKNQTHFSPSDPDGRISTKPGKPYQVNFLSTASVDTEHLVISNIQADFADENDDRHLIAATEKTKARLEDHDLELENILADTNFCSGENYQYLEQENITGFIPTDAAYKHDNGFVYDEENDTYTCQNNKVLKHAKTYINKDGQLRMEYKSTRENCNGCPFASKCLEKNKKTKTLKVTGYRKEYGAAYERVNSRHGKRMMRLRQSTVEPVFGSLINYFGMKKINVKGIESANKAMLGAATAYNLKKYVKFKIKKATSEAKALQKELCEKGKMILNDILAFLFLIPMIPSNKKFFFSHLEMKIKII
jgi:transposase